MGFKARLDYIARPCLKSKVKQNSKTKKGRADIQQIYRLKHKCPCFTDKLT